jgi:hypothetical protein
MVLVAAAGTDASEREASVEWMDAGKATRLQKQNYSYSVGTREDQLGTDVRMQRTKT